MKIKKVLSALLAAVMVLASFAGCGKEKKKEAEEALMPSISTAATGRYVETKISLPDCRYADHNGNGEQHSSGENLHLRNDTDRRQMPDEYEKHTYGGPAWPRAYLDRHRRGQQNGQEQGVYGNGRRRVYRLGAVQADNVVLAAAAYNS